MRRGVYYVAIGDPAIDEARFSIETLRDFHDWPVVVASREPLPINGTTWTPLPRDCDPIGRAAKTDINGAVPLEWDHVLYLDADTRIYGDLSCGFDILEAGFDMVIAPSTNQADDVLWHINEGERFATLNEIVNPEPLQLQGGVFWVNLVSGPAKAFMGRWFREWHRWHEQDQAALLRALYNEPIRIWLLSNVFNGGAVVAHRHGAARGR